MRRVTRYALVFIAIVVVGLLALGSLPGFLGSGPTYYLEVTPVDDDGPAIDANEVTDRRYPYLVGALESADGRSAGYQKGPGDFKEWFTHSPFDEFDALSHGTVDATRDDGDRVIVDYDDERYSVELVREPSP
ncbi:MAG: hypothetical protein ACQETB_06175 [Halobacteriota archaeon]